MITPQSFKQDSHAAAYLPVLEANPDAFAKLVEILNEQANEQFLTAADHFNLPALDGVVVSLEAEPAVVAAIGNQRFRQAVGVAVRLRMEELGWHTTGTKRRVTRGTYFKTAEVYAH